VGNAVVNDISIEKMELTSPTCDEVARYIQLLNDSGYRINFDNGIPVAVKNGSSFEDLLCKVKSFAESLGFKLSLKLE